MAYNDLKIRQKLLRLYTTAVNHEEQTDFRGEHGCGALGLSLPLTSDE